MQTTGEEEKCVLFNCCCGEEDSISPGDASAGIQTILTDVPAFPPDTAFPICWSRANFSHRWVCMLPAGCEEPAGVQHIHPCRETPPEMASWHGRASTSSFQSRETRTWMRQKDSLSGDCAQPNALHGHTAAPPAPAPGSRLRKGWWDVWVAVGYQMCNETSKQGPCCLISHAQDCHLHPSSWDQLHLKPKPHFLPPGLHHPTAPSPQLQSWAPSCLAQSLHLLPFTFF